MTSTTITAAKKAQSLALVLTVFAVLAVGIGTLWPALAIPGPPGTDKTIHMMAFAGIILPSAIFTPRRLFWLVPAAACYGAAIELIQPMVGRTADVNDFLADAAGICIGAGAGLILSVLVPKA